MIGLISMYISGLMTGCAVVALKIKDRFHVWLFGLGAIGLAVFAVFFQMGVVG